MRPVESLFELTHEQADRIAWIERHPETHAVRNWTWEDIQRLTLQASAFLRSHDVGPGDRIVNVCRNSLGWAILDLALSNLRAVHAPIDVRFSDEQIGYCIDLVEPTLIFWDHEPLDSLTKDWKDKSLKLDEIFADSSDDVLDHSGGDANELATILFTSGTSGASRGVMLCHANVTANALAKLDAMPQSEHDHRLNFLPFSHAYAYTCELRTWLLSKSSMEVASGIEGMFRVAPFAKPTLINGVPLFYERVAERWKQDGYSTDGLKSVLGERIRRLASGGAPIASELRDRFSRAGFPIYQGYGLTEASPVVCSNRDAAGSLAPKLREVGPPVQGVEIRIDNASKLWIRGPGVMLGYWRNPEETKRKIVDGWLDTGDLAERVDEGHSTGAERMSLRIIGRVDDTIVLSNGYKIPPMVIEQRVRGADWVEQCLLVGNGKPYPVLLLKLVTIAGAEHSVAPETLLDRLQPLLDGVSDYAKPKRVIVISDVWTAENGLASFKGGLLRKKIETHYANEIDAVYL